MITLTLPDGSRREFEAPVSVMQVAQSIGAGLATQNLNIDATSEGERTHTGAV